MNARSFAIVANGFADGPAQALRDYLVDKRVDVITVSHPLTPEQGTRHLIEHYAHGGRTKVREVDLHLRAPSSYAIDPFVPVIPPRVDVWFGFNPLACARGLAARRLRHARFVVLWSVDFVPDRFGAGTLLTRVYDRIDRACCMRADARVELTNEARTARNDRHRLPPDAAPAHVVPMGAWLDRVPTTAADNVAARRVVFLGHLVPRQGVGTLLDAVRQLADRGESVTAEVIGSGPLEAELRAEARNLGLGDAVRFHGFLEDHREVERLLARGSVAVART